MSDELRDFCNCLHEQIREKDAEIERLKAELYGAGIDYSTMASEIERLQADVAEREKAATWLGGKLARREIDDEWALEALRRWPWL